MRANGERGFTLLELLIAMTLLGLLMLGLFGGLRLGARVWEAGDARAAYEAEAGDVPGFPPLTRALESSLRTLVDGIPATLPGAAPRIARDAIRDHPPVAAAVDGLRSALAAIVEPFAPMAARGRLLRAL